MLPRPPVQRKCNMLSTSANMSLEMQLILSRTALLPSSCDQMPQLSGKQMHVHVFHVIRCLVRAGVQQFGNEHMLRTGQYSRQRVMLTRRSSEGQAPSTHYPPPWVTIGWSTGKPPCWIETCTTQRLQGVWTTHDHMQVQLSAIR